MGNTADTANDAFNKVQGAISKTATVTTQAVSSVASTVGSNKAVAATASTISNFANKTVGVPIQNAVNRSLDTSATFENNATIDVSYLYNCQLRYCKTELVHGNGTVFNTLEYTGIVPIKDKINEMLESQVNPLVEKNIDLVFEQITYELNHLNKQKDTLLVSQIRQFCTKTYGFDAQRHAPIVETLRDIVSEVLDFKKVKCGFENDWFVARLDNEYSFNKLINELKKQFKNTQFDFNKIANWKGNHYFPIHFGSKDLYVDVNVGFEYKNNCVKIFKTRLFNIIQAEMENTIDQNWQKWTKNIKTNPQMNIQLQDADIALNVNLYSQTQIDFKNKIHVRLYR